MKYLFLLSGVFLGWGLGANDSANIFGTAVYSKVIRYWTAVFLTSLFVVLGAYLEGAKGIGKLNSFALAHQVNSLNEAFLVALSAALTVFVMTTFRLPVSTSQAIIGAILSNGMLHGHLDLKITLQFVSSWVVTPIGAMLITMILYRLTRQYIEKKLTNFRFFRNFLTLGYLFSGIFAAYSLGANNVANVFGVFPLEEYDFSLKFIGLLGGLTIAFGVLTYSKPVMSTIGKGIVPLSEVTGLLVVIGTAITLYLYAQVGIPVSSSQAVVGAVIGIGILQGYELIEIDVVKRIFIGWIMTPLTSAVLSYVVLTLF
ncbi:MAG: anion permease [Vallitaleaceae bacterium]|nr:anion permease [Vallitaleaceae bacterium]